MRFITNKNSIARKIVIIILIALTVSFSVFPNYSVYATESVHEEDLPDQGGSFGGSLLKQLIQMVDAIADVIMGTLNRFMLGADGFTSAMLDKNDANLDNPSSWLYVNKQDLADEDIDFEFGEGTIDTSELFTWSDDYQIPNFMYSPESIFSNNIAALDVNFLHPNSYNAVISNGKKEDTDKAEDAAKSGAGENGLQKIISNWYISFRNIAIVGLLSVLVYLGIRIVLSSTAGDKAKYKENLQNWVVALCLVFFMHYIMSGLLMITDQVNNLFDNVANNDIIVKVDSGNKIFRTNLMGYIRFSAQSKSMYNAFAYSALYIVLVIYTGIFTVIYFKRFLYMAFLTMIAPLVALTYPIDKAGDGKAQAFNMWFKEYVMHLVLQPVHLILYTALVSSSMELVKNNLIYGLVAIGFLIPAEKLIKKMFNLDGAQTTSGFGSFAGGALAMKGLNNVAKALGKGKSGGKPGKSSNSSDNEDNEFDNNNIRMQDRNFAQSFGNDDEEGQQNPPLSEGQQDDDRQRMEDDRQVWQDMANNPNETEQNRADAQREVDEINQNLGNQGPDTATEEGTNNQPEIDNPNNYWGAKFAGGMLIKGAKKIGKVSYKAATRGAGIGAGAMIGLAAGVATGDFKNVAALMGSGALAGSTIGKAAGNLPETIGQKSEMFADSINNSAEKFAYEKDKAHYGVARAKAMAAERQNAVAKQKFLDNKAEQEKYEEMAGRIYQKTGKNVDVKELMKKGFDYKEAGIKDEKQIENGLTMETKHSKDKNIHENMIDIVNMTKEYGKDYVLDDKKRNMMQDTIKANIKVEKNQDKVWNLYKETLGLGKLGSKYDMKR